MTDARISYAISKSEQRTADKIETMKSAMANRQIVKIIRNNPLPNLPIKKTVKTRDEDMQAVNPNYSPSNPKTSQNCAMCTVAYDLRRRGYSVKAKESDEGLSLNDMVSAYDNAVSIEMDEFYEEKNRKNFPDWPTSQTVQETLPDLKKELLAMGNGARGNLGLEWELGGGHSIAWEVEGGEVIIRDTQLNKKWKFDECEYWDYTKLWHCIRYDNCRPTKSVYNYIEYDYTDYLNYTDYL